MYKRTLFRLLAILIVLSMILAACKTETEEPVVEPTEAGEPAATEVKQVEPTEPSVEEVVPCPASTVADPMGVPAGTWPEQYDLAEYEALADCEMTLTSRDEFHPDLWTHGFIEGDLPALEERLPAERDGKYP